MRRFVCLLLLLAACGGNNNNGSCNNNNMKEQYRTGAMCASDQSCPPGQICTAGNICYATCTMPGFQNTTPNSCCECCSFSAPNSGSGANCDLDLFCKPGCNPGGTGATGCNAGSCSSGQICDTMYNICRTPCSSTNPCPTGQECVSTFDGTMTCNYCRPKAGAGTLGQACRTTSKPCDNGLTCDTMTNTCLFMCGIGGMTCNNGPNCPSNYGCDPTMNICRPLCQGGSCPAGTSGTCTRSGVCDICMPSSSNGPTTLATVPNANHIAIDVNNVYWTAGNSGVFRCAIMGCNNQPTQVASSPSPNSPPFGIAVSNNTVFWDNLGASIASCPAQGTCGNPAPIDMPNEIGGGGIAVGGGPGGAVVYSTGSHVYSCPMVGCNSGNRGTLFSNAGGSDPEWIAFNSGIFYFGAGGMIYQSPGGSSATPVTSAGGGNVHGIVADGSDIFWTTDATVMQCSTGGCGGTPRTVATGRANPRGIAVDPTNVYWTENDSILFCGRTASCGQPQAFISGQSPLDIAIDGTNVYWTNNDGSVKKMHK